VYHSDLENLSCISIKKIDSTVLQSWINSKKFETETKLLNQIRARMIIIIIDFELIGEPTKKAKTSIQPGYKS